MKKLLHLFIASLLVFTSCSGDDDNSVDPATSILVKKIVNTSKNSYTSESTYSGNKVVSVVDSNGYKSFFTYSGNLITKIEVTSEKKGGLYYTIEYEYTNGKLTSYLLKQVDATYEYKTTYSYNTDGTVFFTDFRINVQTGTIYDGATVGKYIYSAGNLVKKEYSSNGADFTITYEYDSKNNPIKNITGYALLLDKEEEISTNNVTKRAFAGAASIETMTYTYDANNFPTERKSFYNGNLEETNQYTY